MAEVDARDVRRLERSPATSGSDSHSRRRPTVAADDSKAPFRIVGSGKHRVNHQGNKEHDVKSSETPLVRLKRVRRDGDDKADVIPDAGRSATVPESRGNVIDSAPPKIAAAASPAHVNERQRLQHHLTTDLSKAAVGVDSSKPSSAKVDDVSKPQQPGAGHNNRNELVGQKKVGNGKQRGKGQRTGKGNHEPADGVNQKALIEKIKAYRSNRLQRGKQRKLTNKAQRVAVINNRFDGVPPSLTPSSLAPVGTDAKNRPSVAERQKQRKQKQRKGSGANGLTRDKSPVSLVGIGEDRSRGNKNHERKSQKATAWKTTNGLRQKVQPSGVDGSYRRILSNASPKTVDYHRPQSQLHASSHLFSEPISNRRGPLSVATGAGYDRRLNVDDKRTRKNRKKRRLPSPEVVQVTEQTHGAGDHVVPSVSRGISRNRVPSRGGGHHLEARGGGRPVAKQSPLSDRRTHHSYHTVGLSTTNRHRQQLSRQSTAKNTDSRTKRKRSVQTLPSYRYRDARSYGHRRRNRL